MTQMLLARLGLLQPRAPLREDASPVFRSFWAALERLLRDGPR